MIKLTPEKAPYYENVGLIKIYTALLTQTGTNAPEIIELNNTFKETITAEYVGPGDYDIVKETDFETGRLALNINQDYYPGQAKIRDNENGKVRVTTLNGADANTNDLLFLTTITITQYTT